MKKSIEYVPIVIIDPISNDKSSQSLESSNNDCDCSGGDCACGLTELQEYSSLPSLSSSQRLRILPSYLQTLNDDFSVYYSPYHKLAVLNQPAQSLLSSLKYPETLNSLLKYHENAKGVQTALSNMVTAGIVVSADQSSSKIYEVPQTLSAWLHITDRCNLRCHYCYRPHLCQDMSLEVGRAAVEATFRSAVKHQYSKIKFKYAGGETLLRFALVEELHKYARVLADKNNITVEGIVLSNGTLLKTEITQAMRLLGLRLMISLDGLGQTHDEHRPYTGGHGSFTDVERGVKIALECNLMPHISITVSSKNAVRLAELVAWILERNLSFTLNFYRENDLSMPYLDFNLEEDKIIEGVLAAYKVIENNLPNHSLLASIVDRANLSASHLHTCGVGQNYMVFDYQGRVSKCQMQSQKAVTTVQVDDPLAFIHADSVGIQNLSVEEKEGCRTCEWKYWCTGGCSFATFRATGRYNVKSPNCNIYKAIYPEAIRLEGLRLLKYYSTLGSDTSNSGTRSSSSQVTIGHGISRPI